MDLHQEVALLRKQLGNITASDDMQADDLGCAENTLTRIETLLSPPPAAGVALQSEYVS